MIGRTRYRRLAKYQDRTTRGWWSQFENTINSEIMAQPIHVVSAFISGLILPIMYSVMLIRGMEKAAVLIVVGASILVLYGALFSVASGISKKDNSEVGPTLGIFCSTLAITMTVVIYSGVHF